MSAGLTCDFVVTFKPMVSYERVRFGGMRDAGCGMAGVLAEFWIKVL